LKLHCAPEKVMKYTSRATGQLSSR
jgi:hypothetical protein